MKIASSSGHRHRKHHSVPMAEINIIPLVDITLVLLIIFMATTAFVKESGINMNLPKARSAKSALADDKDLTVALTKDGSMYLNGQLSTQSAIENTMLATAARNPQTRVVVKGDENIAYKRVITVMDMARSAGLARVALGTRIPDDGE